MARAAGGTEHQDLGNLSDGDLRALIHQARELLARRIQERMDEFRMLAREAGFEVTLTKMGEGGEGRGRRRRSQAGEGGEGDDRRRDVLPKYRNPDNPAENWSGRGRKPKWVEGRLAKGASLSDFLISSATEPADNAQAAQ